jgi:rubrerythrin
MQQMQLEELLYQALETEIGGARIYETALTCAVNADLKTEWQKYLEETRHHAELLEAVFSQVGLDASLETPGRGIVRHLGESLVMAMEKAKAAGIPAAAQIVAAECVVLAETKDHQNWELMGQLLDDGLDPQFADAIRPAYEEVEEQEDEHYYHTRGWVRELWRESLGLDAQLPPIEEKRDVRSMREAAEAEEARKES